MRDRARSPEQDPTFRRIRVDADLLVERRNEVRLGHAGAELGQKEREELRVHFERLIQEYSTLEITLPITDEPVRGLCQVLTNNGLETVSSCEGHGKKMPGIHFVCPDQQRLRDIAHVVSRCIYETKYPWQIRIWSSDPGLNPNSPLFFVLEPEQKIEPDDLPGAQEELCRDMDIIALSIMDYFQTAVTSQQDT